MSDYDDSDYDYSSNEDFDAVRARNQERAVKQRFGDACILCGYGQNAELVDVAPILAKRNVKHIRSLREWSTQLADFSPDQDDNLVCFCPNHHWEWMNGYFTIVPSPMVRKQMKEKEIEDFELRQQAVNNGSEDPGRKLLMPPQLPNEFEYIPVTGLPLLQIHNETPSLPETFAFFNEEIEEAPPIRGLEVLEVKKYPLRHWEIPVYAVLLAAYEPLNSSVPFKSAQSDAAVSEVTELVHMYLRPLTPTPSLPEPLSDQTITQIQADLATVQTVYPAGDTMVQAWESPDEAVGQGSSMDNPAGRIDDLGRDEDAMEPMDAEAADFPDSDDDTVVTPAVLASRLQWRHPRLGHGLGSMRLATSADFIIDPDEPQI
ncbi:hypothetical protein FRC04_001633 [Tulasnella sp. 424]|nr:hypothetical protein FRC04_001633 [Tulasnella sp. 424]KAG8968660.1 hypothetical protein FRC05_001466 [Tulasnella sp. 425]